MDQESESFDGMGEGPQSRDTDLSPIHPYILSHNSALLVIKKKSSKPFALS